MKITIISINIVIADILNQLYPSNRYRKSPCEIISTIIYVYVIQLKKRVKVSQA